MVKDFENGVRVVELGFGTTKISQLKQSDEDVADVICFSNEVPIDGKLKGDEVLIHIASFKGAVSYVKAVIDLLKTWKIEGVEEQFKDLEDVLEQALKTE